MKKQHLKKTYSFLLIYMYFFSASRLLATNSDTSKLIGAVVENDFEELVRLLIEERVSVNTAAENGYTAIMFAVGLGYCKKTLDLLIESKANVNAHNDKGCTALMIAAVSNESVDALKILIKNRAKIDHQDFVDKQTALLTAIEMCNEQAVDVLIKSGANLELKDSDEMTGLMRAVNSGYTKIIEILANNGANVNIQDEYKKTILMSATCWGKEILEILINNGADINAQDIDSKTALMYAVANKNPEAVFTLASKKETNLELVSRGKTALMMVMTNEELVKNCNLQKISTFLIESNACLVGIDKEEILNLIPKTTTLTKNQIMQSSVSEEEVRSNGLSVFEDECAELGLVRYDFPRAFNSILKNKDIMFVIITYLLYVHPSRMPLLSQILSQSI